MAKYYSEDREYTQISEKDYSIRSLIEKVMEEHNRDLSTDRWSESNYGVPESCFDDVAEAIMTELGLWENKDEL